MKPYTDATLTEEQRYFNYRLSRVRMMTEGAYGQLKGRWHVLLRKCESSADQTKMVTLARIVLHNMCIEFRDVMSKKCDLPIDPVTNEKRERETVRSLLRDTSAEGSKNRIALTRKLHNEQGSNKVI